MHATTAPWESLELLQLSKSVNVCDTQDMQDLVEWFAPGSTRGGTVARHC